MSAVLSEDLVAQVLPLVSWHPQLKCTVWYEDSKAMPTEVPKLSGIQAPLPVESFLEPPECSVSLAGARYQAHVVFADCWDDVIHCLEGLFFSEAFPGPKEG